jgi:hypothetical protein
VPARCPPLVEIVAPERGEPSLPADRGHRPLVPGEEDVRGLLRGIRDEAVQVQPDLGGLRRVAALLDGAPVEVEQRRETLGCPADDGERQR